MGWTTDFAMKFYNHKFQNEEAKFEYGELAAFLRVCFDTLVYCTIITLVDIVYVEVCCVV